MASEWRQSTWGEEITLEYGKALRDHKGSSGKYRVFGSNGPIGWTDRYLAKGPAVILGRKGAYRGVGFSKEPFWVIDTAYYVVPKANLDPRWLYYSIKHHRLGEIDDGSPIPSTTRLAVAPIEVAVPPIGEQQLVGQVLELFDDRIDLLRQTNTTLEAIAQALFKSWFVDFDTVRAKAEGREPEGMDAATAALFPSEFEESELGLIPRGWRVGVLRDLLELQRGFDLPSTQRTSGRYPIIAASGRAGNHVEPRVSGPGVVTGRSGVLGKVFLELEDFWPLNTTLWVRDFAESGPCYAYELLRRIGFGQFNAGSAVPTLNRNHVHGLPQLVPAPAAIAAFETTALSIHRRIQANRECADLLSEVRDSLLPRLISGKLRIREAEALMDEVSA